MRKKQKQPQKSKVSVDFEGKRYSASYFVSSGTVTVESEYGSATTHWEGPKAEFMARQLLCEIVHEAKSRGELRNQEP
jgi:hypothetical protein